MSDNTIKFPHGVDVTDATFGDESLSDYTDWTREGWVGLARTRSRNDSNFQTEILMTYAKNSKQKGRAVNKNLRGCGRIFSRWSRNAFPNIFWVPTLS